MSLKHTPKLRIIPKLEIKNQNLIKGIKFEGLRIVGDPIVFAEKYYKDNADQINIIDIVDQETVAHENKTLVELYGIHIPVLEQLNDLDNIKLFWPFTAAQIKELNCK